MHTFKYIKLLFFLPTVLYVAYFGYAYTACLGLLNKMAPGRARRYIFFPLLREYDIYLLDVHKPLLRAVFRI